MAWGLGKECTRCLVYKPLAHYYRAACGVFGRRSWCKSCCSETAATRHTKKKEYPCKGCGKLKQTGGPYHYCEDCKRFCKVCLVKPPRKGQTRCKRCASIKYSYGVDDETSRRLQLILQCQICHRDLIRPGPKVSAKSQHIDHCHATGAVRGVLCSRCNTAIGLIDDRPEVAKAMCEYLVKSKNFDFLNSFLVGSDHGDQYQEQAN